MNNKNDFSIFACFSISNDIPNKNKMHLVSSAVACDSYDPPKILIGRAESLRKIYGRHKKFIIIIVHTGLYTGEYGYEIAHSSYDLLVINVTIKTLFLEFSNGNTLMKTSEVYLMIMLKL